MIQVDSRFLTGAMYAPFCRTTHAPMEEWEQDIKNMAELGFNCIHGFAEWHDIEYNKGEFDFTQIDYMIECQGEQHFRDIVIYDSKKNNIERDNIKYNKCNTKNLCIKSVFSNLN